MTKLSSEFIAQLHLSYRRYVERHRQAGEASTWRDAYMRWRAKAAPPPKRVLTGLGVVP